MAVVNPIDQGIGLRIKKKLGRSSEYGQKLYGKFEYGEQDDRFGIYRSRHRWGKIVLEKMLFYWPANPQTEAQQTHRQKYGAGVEAWNNLTNEQKEIYNEIARYKPYSGYNLYIREYILSH